MKVYDNHFNSWIDKKDIVKMREYLPEPKSSGGRMKVNLSNYLSELSNRFI